MESPELMARLRYLNDSSHLLTMSAPVTSRYLMSRHNALSLESDMETQKEKACGACGTIFIVGWEASAKLLRRKRTKDKQPSDGPRELVYTCKTCDRTTSFPLPPPPKVVKRPVAPVPISNPSLPAQPGPVVSSSIQKKRSKAAKHGGLKALLQKKKESTASASGFDLMDFMKTTGT